MSYARALVTTALSGVVAVSGLLGGAAVARPSTAATPTLAGCTSITVSLGRREGAAGSTYQMLRLRNASHRPCAVRGFPRVAYVNRDRIMIGWPARHDRSPVSTVRLAPGETAHAVLRLPDPGVYKPIDCLKHHVNRLRVRIGADRRASFVRWNLTECTTRYGRASIGPVH